MKWTWLKETALAQLLVSQRRQTAVIRVKVVLGWPIYPPWSPCIETAVRGICMIIYDFCHERSLLEINHSFPLSCKFFKGENWSSCKNKNSPILLLHWPFFLTGSRSNKVFHLMRACPLSIFTLINHCNKNRVALIPDRWSYEQSQQQVLLDSLPLAIDIT